MRILRLTNSNDFLDSIPEHLRVGAVTQRVVAEATGEPVDVVSRACWPSAGFPKVLGEWLERYDPDVVLIRCAAYWVAFESVPLRVERRLGWMGKWPAKLGKAMGEEAAIASNRVAASGRRFVVRTVGGDTYFTPEAAANHVEAMLRVVVAKESILPIVRGPGHAHNSAGTRRGLNRALRRIQAFEDKLRVICERMRVPFFSSQSVADPAHLGADDVHSGVEGAQAFGTLEGRAIADAWLESKSRR